MTPMDGASSGSGYYNPTDTDSDPALCKWVKFETAENKGDGGDGSGEWFVYGHPEQGAAAHRTVLVRAKSSGRITRVRLGVQVAYNTYEVGKRLGVVFTGRGNGDTAYGADGGGGHTMSDEEYAHTTDYSLDGGNSNNGSHITRVPDRAGRPQSEFCWQLADGRWLVHGPAGRTGEAVRVFSRRTGRRTLVYLANKVSEADDGRAILYDFARC